MIKHTKRRHSLFLSLARLEMLGGQVEGSLLEMVMSSSSSRRSWALRQQTVVRAWGLAPGGVGWSCPWKPEGVGLEPGGGEVRWWQALQPWGAGTWSLSQAVNR